MKNQSEHKSIIPDMGLLSGVTIEIPPGTEANLARIVDLTGLVYDELDHPVVIVGLPKEYVPEFQHTYFKRGTKVTATKKPTGNRYYTRISRAVDVYRLCQALDGKTKIHQRAVRAIMRKLESHYGRGNLQAIIREY